MLIDREGEEGLASLVDRGISRQGKATSSLRLAGQDRHADGFSMLFLTAPIEEQSDGW